MHDIDVRGESKLFGHVGFVLWRVITECNEPESDEVLGKVSRSRDLVADATDGSACRLNVGTLAARRVLEEDDIPRIAGVRSDDQGIAWALDLQGFIVGNSGISTVLRQFL